MKKEEIELTDSQLKIISHSLGIDIIRAKESDNEKYKFLPEEFYRNYYCVGKSLNMTDDMKLLEELGFIEKWINGEQLYFEITKEGVDYFKDWFEKEITVKIKALYHPAYLLRMPTQKLSLWKDLISIKKDLNLI